MNNIIKRVWNQNRLVNIEDLTGMVFQAEADGHTFEISGVDDEGNAVALSGSVAGVFRRPDNADIALTGSASDGVVSVTLSEDCYAVPGRFGLTIFVTSNSQKVAVYACVGTVAVSSTGNVAGDTPASVEDLIDDINAAIADLNAAIGSIPADYSQFMAAIAPTYSSSALYVVGSYAWHDGDLYSCITPITTAEAWTATHWTTADIGADLSELKNKVIRREETVYAPDLSNTLTYYNTAGNTISRYDGEFVKSTAGTKSDNYVIAVTPGEVFVITSTGKGAGAYAFIGELFSTYANVKARYGVNSTVTNETVTVPDGATYLIVNNWDVGNGMVKKVSTDPIVYQSDLAPIQEGLAKLNKKCKCVYSTRTIAYSSMVECLDVYIPAKVGYVDYIFGRTQSETPQSEGGGNVWRLVQIDAVDDSLSLRYHITQLGETEMAIMIYGRNDFIGGTTHGDEWMDNDSLLFSIDGAPVDITTVTTLTEFDILKCFLVSNMYDPDDHTTLVGVHGREWVFDESGLYIGQTVEFKANLTLGSSYMPMVCALRGNDTASALQVTDTYADDGNYQTYDVSTGGFTTYPNQLKNGIKRVNLWGATSGVNITVDYLVRPENLRSSGVFLYNAVNTYNKIYDCLCDYGNGAANAENVNNGDKWIVKSKISVNIGK